MATDEMYMENLQEYINDENKVITYKWLSRNLQVHVNQAKQMLYTFVQKERNANDNDALSVFYLVAGVASLENGTKTMKISIAPEEKLEVAKSSLDPVTSCHVYSVQKAKLKDTNALYIADYTQFKEDVFGCNQFSAIKCKSAVARSTTYIKKLKEASKPVVIQQENKSKPVQNGSAKPKSKPSVGIAGMFATATKKVEESKNKNTDKEETKQEEFQNTKSVSTKDKGKQGGVMSFFAKQTAGSKSKPNDVKEKQGKIQEKQEKSPPKKGENTKSSRKIESDDEDSKPQQNKRRRIQQVMESSSEEEDEEEMPESPIPSPPREPTPPRSPEVPTEEQEDTNQEEPMESQTTHTNDSQGKRRKRRRKLVPKTYLDDDGFMVTEKVWESESCTDQSETEEAPPKAPLKEAAPQKEKANKKSSPKKKSPPSKTAGKQSSIMGFFKKK